MDKEEKQEEKEEKEESEEHPEPRPVQGSEIKAVHRCKSQLSLRC